MNSGKWTWAFIEKMRATTICYDRHITLKTLFTRYQCKLMYDWDHTANIMAATLNSMGGTKAGPVHPYAMHPYRKSVSQRQPATKRALAGAFLGV